MAGFGGVPKLSFAQQNEAIGDLLPVFIMGMQALDHGVLGAEESDEEMVGLLAQLDSCLGEIRMLIMDIEEGNSRSSVLDADELDFKIGFLRDMVLTLSGRIRSRGALRRR